MYTEFGWCCFNPLVPRVQKIKIRNLTLNRLLIVEFVKIIIYLGAHYSESGSNGLKFGAQENTASRDLTAGFLGLGAKRPLN